MTDDTCWTLIKSAADDDTRARSLFAKSYLPVVRAYLASRWKGSSFAGEIDDAVQDVFLECYRSSGVLDRIDPGQGGGFRAFLFGVVRNVAARKERQRARQWKHQAKGSFHPEFIESDETHLSLVFDRAWARSIMQEAAELQHESAKLKGEIPLRRVEILRLRFQENLSLKEIASNLGMEASKIYYEYSQAQKEFKEALNTVVLFNHPGTSAEVERECVMLMGLLK